MSTSPRRRRSVILPSWLATAPIAAFARKKDRAGKSVSDRVMVAVTVEQRAGLNRIAEAAKRARVPLEEPAVMRIALDRLLRDFEAEQLPEPVDQAQPEPSAEEPQS